MSMNPKDLYNLFKQVNKDCESTDEQVVELTRDNFDYYAEQLQNLYDLTDEKANVYINDMFTFIERRELILNKLHDSDDLFMLAHNLCIEVGEENGFNGAQYIPCFDIDN